MLGQHCEVDLTLEGRRHRVCCGLPVAARLQRIPAEVCWGQQRRLCQDLHAQLSTVYNMQVSVAAWGKLQRKQHAWQLVSLGKAMMCQLALILGVKLGVVALPAEHQYLIKSGPLACLYLGSACFEPMDVLCPHLLRR